MDNDKIIQELNKRFAAPLPEFYNCYRRDCLRGTPHEIFCAGAGRRDAGNHRNNLTFLTRFNYSCTF